jgi:hypothetical protein
MTSSTQFNNNVDPFKPADGISNLVMSKKTMVITQSEDKKSLLMEGDYYIKVEEGRKFWGWGKHKLKCRYFVFWIPFGESCDHCWD